MHSEHICKYVNLSPIPKNPVELKLAFVEFLVRQSWTVHFMITLGFAGIGLQISTGVLKVTTCSELKKSGRVHINTHRVDSHYKVLIVWNLNNAQAKQCDS